MASLAWLQWSICCHEVEDTFCEHSNNYVVVCFHWYISIELTGEITLGTRAKLL